MTAGAGSTAEERATLVVQLATRAFRDGSRAAAWLGAPNAHFEGRAPLAVALESAAGCAKVCENLGNLVID